MIWRFVLGGLRRDTKRWFQNMALACLYINVVLPLVWEHGSESTTKHD